ncbi:hypothetical protein [uncultured Abyssibacter sp.]|uniref:hypothetical protein n=1 Tax=uncultured Abyssibacter sp. TaxID=2320202 RepID=UPI0032B15E53|tara:strand:- start:355 stop:753 length:399 start_codon:yes stop_codon:yes gene_type:complete
MAQEPELPEFKLDEADLYREDVFTDRKAGTIRRMTPVTATGEDDSSRPVMFEGQASVLTPGGALPLNFELPGPTFEDALAQYPDAARAALEQTIEDINRMRREQQSSIVVPGQQAPSPGLIDPSGGRGGSFR